MAISFPSSPSVGQVYLDANLAWMWTGSAWESVEDGTRPYFAAATIDAGSASAAALTITSPTFPAERVITGLQEVRVAVGTSNAINLGQGNVFTKTVSATTTFALVSPPMAGYVCSFVLEITNGGSQTVNWFSGVKWASGVAPTLTSAGKDCLGFYTHDGGVTWNAFVLGLDVR